MWQRLLAIVNTWAGPAFLRTQVAHVCQTPAQDANLQEMQWGQRSCATSRPR